MAKTPVAERVLTAELVSSLLSEQAPALSELPVSHYDGGFDNELFRLGDTMLVRLPRREAAAQLMEHELRWVPVVGQDLPVETPMPIMAGRPGQGFEWPWSIVPWVEGVRVTDLPPSERVGLAETLADVLHLLHTTAPADAPVNPFRGGSLNRPEADAQFRARLGEADVDPDAVLPRWQAWRTAADWDGPELWVHGDLHPHNLLADADGGLAAVIDWGDVTAGDPACDLATAWLTFDRAGRERFIARANLSGAYDEATWLRARAWALHLALFLLTGCDDRPALRGIGVHALGELLAEPLS